MLLVEQGRSVGDFWNCQVRMMESFGLPCPAFMAAGGLFSLLAGSLCYLTGRLLCLFLIFSWPQQPCHGQSSTFHLTGIPVLMEWGAEFLLMFLILGIGRSGHETNFLNCLTV